MNKFEQKVTKITGDAGWIEYISWCREDLDYAMYKNINFDTGSRRFLRVYKENGAWEITSSKRNDAKVLRSGRFVDTLSSVLIEDPVTTPTELEQDHSYDHLAYLKKNS